MKKWVGLSSVYASLFFPVCLIGATFVVPPDRELVQEAQAIVVGSALNSFVQLTAEGGIETVTTFSIEEVLKGDLTQSIIDIHEPGGRYGNVVHSIPGVPRFHDGERVLLFMLFRGRSWRVLDIALGRFTFETDRAGQKILVRDEGAIHGWDADHRVHRERRRSAERFLQFIRTEARGGHGVEDYFVPYHPLRLQPESLKPISNVAYSATSYTIDIELGDGTGKGARWNVFPTSVNFYRGTTTEPGAPGGGDTAINAAFSAWNSDCGSNVDYVYAGVDDGTHTGGITGSSDGRNTILFERDLSLIGTFTCNGGGYSGLLGVGGTWAVISPDHIGPNGEHFATTFEGDVEMNQGIANCTLLFNNGDFNSAVTHEVGHTLGFRHADGSRGGGSAAGTCGSDAMAEECSTNAIMKAFITNNLNAALQGFDVNAVRAVYPASCVVPTRFDSSGDGKADLFWRNDATGGDAMWFMSGATVSFSVAKPTVGPDFRVVAIGDFNGDQKADILWRNSVTGSNVIWFMDGGTLASSAVLPVVADLNWVVSGVGDFQGDGKADIFWHNNATGSNSIWLMNGSSIATSGALPPVVDTTWHPVGVGDFQGDGKDDIVWRNSSTGANVVWLMNGMSVAVSAVLPLVSDTNWQVVGVGDFQGDGKGDLLWRNSSTGGNVIWFMNGTTVAVSGVLTTVADPNWKVARVGDFQGDGKADIVWRNDVLGASSQWLMNGAAVAASSALPPQPGPGFKIAP